MATKPFPQAPPLKKLIGPSFILLGLGLGSGEVILWPYLSSNFGLGIIWAAVLGIFLQFIMNMEIERYALSTGESIFAGFSRVHKKLPIWFILSTFLPWLWPGIAATSAKIFGNIFGISDTKYITVTFLVIMGLILTLGPVLYKTVENLQKIIIGIGVPSIFILAIVMANQNDWQALGNGLLGIGEGYRFLPAMIPLASFLGAFAYAGAGGNLNLAQSFYVKEKGYGMGKYGGKITSLLTGKSDELKIYGASFELNQENLTEYKKWWQKVNLEHFVVFFLTGAVTILLLSLLAYSTTHRLSGTKDDVNFVLLEGKIIGERVAPFVGTFFLAVCGLTLFGTQLTVFDAASRILAENIVLLKNNPKGKDLRKAYYLVLWGLIVCGVLIMLSGFAQPLQLLTTAAVLNAVAMFIHSGLTLFTNLRLLPKAIRPTTIRIVLMLVAFFTYGGFSIYTIIDKIL